MKPDLILLRVMLIVVAVTGLPCGGVLFIPWESTVAIVKRLGIGGVPPAPSPIIEYWMLMMAAVCVVVGYLYLVAALDPWRYKSVLPILGWGLILIGAAAAYHGFRLRLAPWPFYADLGVCALCGPGILWLSKGVTASVPTTAKQDLGGDQ